MNLERLETVGDSFLKLSSTNYMFHNHVNEHEGKLSFARSKEVRFEGEGFDILKNLN